MTRKPSHRVKFESMAGPSSPSPSPSRDKPSPSPSPSPQKIGLESDLSPRPDSSTTSLLNGSPYERRFINV